MLWYNNLLFSKCENHNIIITPNHIKNFHKITNPLNLSAILYEDYTCTCIYCMKKLKKNKSKRKDRIYSVKHSLYKKSAKGPMYCLRILTKRLWTSASV